MTIEEVANTRKIECEIHRGDMHIRVVDTTEDRAMLTHIIQSETYSKTSRDAKRMAKEVWTELGNATNEWWPNVCILGIEDHIKTCLGIN